MKDASAFFACFINTKSVPMKINCNNKFNTYNEADKYLDNTLGVPIDRNATYMTTVVPLCKYIPEFINKSRAYTKATNILLVKEN